MERDSMDIIKDLADSWDNVGERFKDNIVRALPEKDRKLFKILLDTGKFPKKDEGKDDLYDLKEAKAEWINDELKRIMKHTGLCIIYDVREDRYIQLKKGGTNV